MNALPFFISLVFSLFHTELCAEHSTHEIIRDLNHHENPSPSKTKESAESLCTHFPLGTVENFPIPLNEFTELNKSGPAPLLLSKSAETVELFDPFTKQILKIKLEGERKTASALHNDNTQLSKDKTALAIERSDGKLEVYSLKTGKSQVIHKAEFALTIESISESGKFIAYTDDTNYYIKDLTTGIETQYPYKKLSENPITFTTLNSGRELATIIKDDNQVLVRDLTNNSESILQGVNATSGFQLLKNGEGYLLKNSSFELSLRHFDGKEFAKLKLAEPSNRGNAGLGEDKNNSLSSSKTMQSPDGSKIIYQGTNGLSIYDTQTGKILPLDNVEPKNIQFSPNGKYFTVSSGLRERNQTTLYEILKSGEVKQKATLPQSSNAWVDNSGTLHGMKKSGYKHYYSYEWKNPNSICADTSQFQLPAPLKEPAQRIKLTEAVLKEANDQDLCRSSYQESKWINFSTQPLGKSPSEADLLKALVRIGKSGSFVPQYDFPLLISALNSGYYKAYPELMSRALQTVTQNNPEAYRILIDSMPAHTIENKINPDFKYCKNESENKSHTEAAQKYLLNLRNSQLEYTGKHLIGTTLNTWKSLYPLAPLLANLPSANTRVDEIAQSLADHAATDPNYEQLGLSKLYRFTAAVVQPIFGIESPPITDIHMIDKNNASVPLLLGSAAFQNTEDDFISPYGFHTMRLPPLNLDNPQKDDRYGGGKLQRKINWNYNGKTYTAEVSAFQVPPIDTYLPTKIKYDELKTDGVLKQVFVIGTNKSVDQNNIINESIDYYRNEGFEFAPPKKVEDITSSFGELIVNGAKVVMKAAHGGGDIYVMMRLWKKGEFITGVKKNKEGKVIEEITLYNGDPQSGEATILNDDLNKWLAKREGSAKGQFVFVNESCWSDDQAVQAIPTLINPDYYPIVSSNCTYEFVNSPDNAVRTIIHGIRNEMSWEEIQSSLVTNKVSGYQILPKPGSPKAAVTLPTKENQWLFPGEPAYGNVTAKITTKIKGVVGEVKVSPSPPVNP